VNARIAIGLALVCGCALEYTVPQDGASLVCEEPEAACGSRCVDLDDDPDHCGACGRACALAEECVEGVCKAACEADGVCGGVCVDVANDPANCGTCGRWCDNDEVCEVGQCVRTCSESCGEHELCVAGLCTCRVGYSVCNDKCVDLQTDDNNCGTCERGCDGQPCGGGECLEDDCAPWPDACEHACTDVATDPANCGACGRECHPSQSCIDGGCKSP
jgi:hypothetical protein